MRKIRVLLFLYLLVIFSVSMVIAAGEKSFKASLSGSHVVPPVKTNARGEAKFQLGKDGTEMTYRITARNIRNITAAHIHSGKKGENGPPVVPLQIMKKSASSNATIGQGTITEKDFINDLKGKSMQDLVKKIEAGDAYVNVHTEKHPDGEIRGQLK